MKQEFDNQLNTLLKHVTKQREALNESNERKIELLKSEVVKTKQELQSFRAFQERQCLCKYYEDTLSKIKEEN